MALVKVNKNGMTHTIEEEWLPSFLEDGWSKGAAKKPKQEDSKQGADGGEDAKQGEDEKGE